LQIVSGIQRGEGDKEPSLFICSLFMHDCEAGAGRYVVDGSVRRLNGSGDGSGGVRVARLTPWESIPMGKSQKVGRAPTEVDPHPQTKSHFPWTALRAEPLYSPNTLII
jgi:hypothetical protein